MSAEKRTVTVEPLDAVGRGRIADARRRLNGWNGTTWRVTPLPVPDQAKMHIRPDTEDCVDWLGFWVKAVDDPHVRVSPIETLASARVPAAGASDWAVVP